MSLQFISPKHLVLIVGLLASVLVPLPAIANQDPAGPQTHDEMIVVPRDVSQARFKPLYPDRPDGLQISPLWGDPKTGPSAALFKFPKNFRSRLHWHSADYHLFLVEGRMRQWNEGQGEADSVELTPGGYRFQPGHRVHAETCLTDYCIAFIKYDGPMDTTIAAPAK